MSSADGEQGLVAGADRQLRFVLLDLLLPGLDGLEVLRELHRQRPGLPVLILSARRDLATKLRGFELGAVDYLAKPFSLDELLARAAGADAAIPRRRRGTFCGPAGWRWTSPAVRPGSATPSRTCPIASFDCCIS